jgi:hypothetical protein
MAAFEAKYTPEQRAAMAHAFEDERIRPARLVVELAKAGKLKHAGVELEPFETNEDTVRDAARHLRKQRRGEISSKLEHMPPRDAIETLRRRLVNAADALLSSYENQLRSDAGKADPERLRQIVRAVREAASLPGPNDARPAAPGARVNGARDGAETKAGLAGKILHAHRTGTAGADTAHDAPPQTDEDGEHGDREDAAHHAAQHADQSGVYTQEDGTRGLGVRVLADSVGVDLR